MQLKIKPSRFWIDPTGPDWSNGAVIAPFPINMGQGIQILHHNSKGGRIVPSHVLDRINRLAKRRFGINAGEQTSGSVVVDLDNIEGCNSEHDLINGGTWTQSAVVKNLSAITPPTGFPALGNNSANSLNWLAYAEIALTSALGANRGSSGPLMPDQYGNMTTPCYLQSLHCTAQGKDYAEFKIVWKGYRINRWSMSGSLSSIESNLDGNGTSIIVDYKYPQNYGTAGCVMDGGNYQFAGQYRQQGWLGQHTIVEQTISLDYIQQGVTIGSATLNGMEAYFTNARLVGTVNSGNITIDGFTMPTGTALFLPLEGTSDDNQMTCTAKISLHYRASGWTEPACYKTETGDVPYDAATPSPGTSDPGSPAPYSNYSGNVTGNTTKQVMMKKFDNADGGGTIAELLTAIVTSSWGN